MLGWKLVWIEKSLFGRQFVLGPKKFTHFSFALIGTLGESPLYFLLTIPLQLSGNPPIESTQLWSVRSKCIIFPS